MKLRIVLLGAEEALQIVLPLLRHNANIIELVKFTKADITEFANAAKSKPRRNIAYAKNEIFTGYIGCCRLYFPGAKLRA